MNCLKSLLSLLNLLLVFSIYAKPPKQTPNYGIIFPQNKVNTLEIIVGKVNWDNIQADMKAKFGNEFGKSSFPKFDGKMPPMPPNRDADFVPSFGKGEPEYVNVLMKFKGKTYENVNFRLKGNSSLMQAWGSGTYKLPFRLGFDDMTNFNKKSGLHGFKKLSFSPGMSDKSLIREKTTADIFRQAGVYAPKTAFYKIYIDFGEGLKYCGIYTAVEVVEDTMIESQFKDVPQGNLYKPESNLTKFDKALFEKKNNKKQADWSDIEAFIKVLNDPNRTEKPKEWRIQLEKVFNMEHFIKWLAVNTTLVNWDTYGAMSHNYYLYNSPTKKLTWIPWDNDLAMGAKLELKMPEGFKPPEGMKVPEGFKPPEGMKMPEGFKPPMGGMPFGNGISLPLKGINKRWILLKAVADDEVYFDLYKKYINEFTKNVFNSSKMNAIFEKNHQLIKKYVIGKEKEEKPYSYLSEPDDFIKELDVLKKHIIDRNSAVNEFLK